MDDEERDVHLWVTFGHTLYVCVLIQDVDLNLRNGSRGLRRVLSNTPKPSWLMSISPFFL